MSQTVVHPLSCHLQFLLLGANSVNGYCPVRTFKAACSFTTCFEIFLQVPYSFRISILRYSDRSLPSLEPLSRDIMIGSFFLLDFFLEIF